MQHRVICAFAIAAILLAACTEAPPSATGESTAAVESTALSTAAPTETPTQAPTERPTLPPTLPPTEPPTESPTLPSTEPPTEVPTEPPTQPATNPPIEVSPGETLPAGSPYTRAELEALDRTFQGYGPGANRDNRNRPTGPIYLNGKYAQYDAHFIAPDDGNIYLTFDCGYEYQNLTADILDTLLEKNVKAVFFVNMHFTEANPHLIQRIINEGHILANHCSGHPRLPEQSLDEIIRQIMEMHDYVLEHYGYTMTLFRPPSGYFSEQVLAVAQALGYKTVQYSFAYVDWDTDNQPDVAASLDRITSSAHSGAIYLLHAVSSTNAAVLGEAIDAFRAQGYNLALYQ